MVGGGLIGPLSLDNELLAGDGCRGREKSVYSGDVAPLIGLRRLSLSSL